MQKKSAFIAAIFALSIGSSAFASTSLSLTGDSALRIEPIVGYSTSFRDKPTGHTSTNLVYGARVSYGTTALSGELEYTKGTDTEKFDTAPEKIVTKEDQLKLGIRSTYYLGEYFFVSGRLGGQASQGTIETTDSGVVTKEDKDLEVYPYAGAGLGVHLGSFLTLSAGTVVVFTNGSSMRENEVQNTIALSVGLN